jgi:hypothetical protein
MYYDPLLVDFQGTQISDRTGYLDVSTHCGKHNSLRAGFEPAREDPIGFQVQRLNHSAIAACKPDIYYTRGSVNTYVAKSNTNQ